MKETYVMEYYLPNQSHLFSEPMRFAAHTYEILLEKVAIAQRFGYDIIAVTEVRDDGYAGCFPVDIPSLIADM